MRVVHVAARFPPAEGGGERHVARLTSELAKLGNDVTVVTTKMRTEVPQVLDPRLPDEESVEGVRVVRVPIRSTGIPAWGYGFEIPNLRALVDRFVPDVVHLHGYGYKSWDALVRDRAGARWKVALTSHGFVEGRGAFRPLKGLYNLLKGPGTVGALDAAIALTPTDAATFTELGARRVEVIPNGVEYERFAHAKPDQDLLAKLRVDAGRYVLNVSRIEKVKGQDLLLEAFARAASPESGIDLVLAGEGTASDEVRDLARSLGVDDRVRFAGRLLDPQVASLVKTARVFAHTPREEPFGIVYLEAMAAEVPTLGTNVGGVPFATGGAALLVAPSPPAIAEGLHDLLTDEPHRARLIGRGRHHAKAQTWTSNAARVHALYKELVAAG